MTQKLLAELSKTTLLCTIVLAGRDYKCLGEVNILVITPL